MPLVVSCEVVNKCPRNKYQLTGAAAKKCKQLYHEWNIAVTQKELECINDPPVIFLFGYENTEIHMNGKTRPRGRVSWLKFAKGDAINIMVWPPRFVISRPDRLVASDKRPKRAASDHLPRGLYRPRAHALGVL